MSWILQRMGKGKEIKIKKDELGQGEFQKETFDSVGRINKNKQCIVTFLKNN